MVEFTATAILNCQITDPHISSVVLLLGFEGEDGSKGAPGLTDESPAAHGTGVISNLTTAIDAAEFKFGSSSLLVAGFLPHAIFENSQDWVLSSSNSDQFTVESWVRFSSIDDNSFIVGKGFFGATRWSISAVSGGEFRFRFVNNSAATVTVTSSGAALSTGVWCHLAVDKSSSGTIRLYKNGVMVGSATPADSSIQDLDDILLIGSAGDAGLAGWLDELRITKGVARYASDSGFPVPTAAFPRPES